MKKFERGNLMTGESLASELPSLALHHDVIVNRDLCLSSGWSLQLPNTLLLGDGGRGAVTTAFRALINALPSNYDWQLRWVQHSRTRELDDVFSKRPKPSGMAGEIVQETEAVTLGLLGTGDLSWKEAQLFLIRRPNEGELDAATRKHQSAWQRFAIGGKRFLRTLLPGNAVKEAQVNAEVFEEMVRDLRGMVDTFEVSLRGAGLFPVRLTSAALMRVLYEWANKDRYQEGGTPANYPRHGGAPLSELYSLTEFEWCPTGGELPPGIARMGNFYQAILTLAQPPEELRLGVWEELLYSGLTKFEMTTWATPTDKRKRIEKLKRLLTASRNKGDAPDLRRMRAELERELEELGGNADRLWRLWTTVRVWGSTPEEAQQAASQLLILSEASGRIGLVHERHNLWSFFRATCPGWGQDRDIYRAIDVTTRQASRLIPFNGQPSFLRMAPELVGAVFPTISSTGSILNIDPHERSLYSAPHFLIMAGTGQGKSVLVSSLMLELLGSDGVAVMIDRGGSFNGIAAAMGVTPILLQRGNRSVRLNPLHVTPGKVPDADELGAMLSILEVMVTSSAQLDGRLDGDNIRLLRETVVKVFEKSPGKEIFLSSLRDALASTQSGRYLASHLTTWCAGGEYGDMFDGPSTIGLGNRLTVIDLGQDARGTNAALTNVLTALIINIVSQVMTQSKARRKYVIFDEAGVLAKIPALADFLDYAYRTFRKSGTGCGALTQKAMDLASLFSYAPLKFFLRQDDLGDTAEAAVKAGFSPETVEFIRDLVTRPGEFADFIVVQKTQEGTQSHLCRNYVTPLKYAMITSDKEDTAAIDSIMREERLPRDQAMRVFAKKFPRGVAHARTNQAAA